MNKRWLSQLSTDAAFPLLVLALAVSQIKIGRNENANLLDYPRQSTELPSDDHLSRKIETYASPHPSKSARVAERPAPLEE